MKRRIIAVALAVIAIAILSAGTIAYFTSEQEAHNIITTSGVDVTLQEWADEGGGTPFPSDPVLVMPGERVDKIVTVRNNEADAFLRASFEIILYNEAGEEINPDNLAEAVVIEPGSDWVEDGGWYYYNSVLSAGDVTEPLFSEVVFYGPSMTNEYQNCTCEVIVTVQAVQAANNAETAVDASGWPIAPQV